MEMTTRWVVLSAGLVAVMIGVTGMLTPIEVGPGDVGCGSVAAADLSAARAATERGGTIIPVSEIEPGGIDRPADSAVIVRYDYVELCRQELEDRRIGTIALVGIGAVAALGTLAAPGWARNRSGS